MRQLSLLDEVKKAYQEHRSAFIPGATMQAILLALGARLEDFAKLQQVSGNLADDPTLPFRKSRNGRFCFDFDRAQIERLGSSLSCSRSRKTSSATIRERCAISAASTTTCS